MQLNFTDWSIVFLYFVFVLVIGFIYVKRAGRSIDEYFVSGRNLPWWIVGTSMVATTFSSDTPNLVTDLVRNDGVSANWRWWPFLLTGMVTVFFYAKLWRRSGALTDISFYELRYSGKPAAFLRAFRAVYLGVFFNVVVMASVTLAAIKFGNVLLGLDKYTTVLVCSLITVIYSCTSGLWGVVVTDLVLFVLAMIGSIGAAYYSLSHPAVGGLTGLLSNEALAGKINLLPDFSNMEELIPLLIVPFAVQWWSVWYPGAEPGGGGYIAQRMLASKDEKNSMIATLWFNVLHYAVRPWPWIIVALCSLVVFPDLSDIAKQFPQLEKHSIAVRHDLGYPAMLTFLPHGMLGLVVASLAAAYMSTISTHLNWGASYVVDDFYKRFMVTDAGDHHYVTAARIVTVSLMVLACLVSFFLSNAMQAFEILLQIGAGTGLIFLLRWFWWRINAWTEITGMVVSFLIAVYFVFHKYMNFPALETWQELTIGVFLTTLAWLTVTFLTPPTDRKVLQSFYDKIHPMGPGWAGVVERGEEVGKENITASVLAVFLGCLAVYGALFSTGFFLYGKMVSGVVFAIISISSILSVLNLLPRIGWRE